MSNHEAICLYYSFMVELFFPSHWSSEYHKSNNASQGLYSVQIIYKKERFTFESCQVKFDKNFSRKNIWHELTQLAIV